MNLEDEKRKLRQVLHEHDAWLETPRGKSVLNAIRAGSIWLCNIRLADGDSSYTGREVTEDDNGCYRDGQLYALASGSFELLCADGMIEVMDMFPDWYEGRVPMKYIAGY